MYANLEDRRIRTWSLLERAVRFDTEASIAADKFGGALPVGTSRAVIASPIFDLKPWLRDEQSQVDTDFGTPVDTSSACDLYDPHLHIFLYAARGARLADDVNLGSLRIWAMERGHPVDPQRALYFQDRKEVTDIFIDQVNEAWIHAFRPNGMRFWGGSLVLEATTESLPTVISSLSMH